MKVASLWPSRNDHGLPSIMEETSSLEDHSDIKDNANDSEYEENLFLSDDSLEVNSSGRGSPIVSSHTSIDANCQEASMNQNFRYHVNRNIGGFKDPEAPDEFRDRDPTVPNEVSSRDSKAPEVANSRDVKAPEVASSRDPQLPDEFSARYPKVPDKVSSRDSKAPEVANSRDAIAPEVANSRDAIAPEVASSRDPQLPDEFSARFPKVPDQVSSRDSKAPEVANSRDAKAPEVASSRDPQLPDEFSARYLKVPDKVSSRDSKALDVANSKDAEAPEVASFRDPRLPDVFSGRDPKAPDETSSRNPIPPDEAASSTAHLDHLKSLIFTSVSHPSTIIRSNYVGKANKTSDNLGQDTMNSNGDSVGLENFFSSLPYQSSSSPIRTLSPFTCSGFSRNQTENDSEPRPATFISLPNTCFNNDCHNPTEVVNAVEATPTSKFEFRSIVNTNSSFDSGFDLSDVRDSTFDASSFLRSVDISLSSENDAINSSCSCCEKRVNSDECLFDPKDYGRGFEKAPCGISRQNVIDAATDDSEANNLCSRAGSKCDLEFLNDSFHDMLNTLQSIKDISREKYRATVALHDTCFKVLLEKYVKLESGIEEKKLNDEINKLKEEISAPNLSCSQFKTSLVDRNELEKSINLMEEELKSLKKCKESLSRISLKVHKYMSENRISQRKPGHDELKEKMSELYSMWDDRYNSVSSQLKNSQQLANVWKQFEAHQTNFLTVLNEDEKTIQFLDTALQGGAISSDIAASVRGVAKVLSEKHDDNSSPELLTEALCGVRSLLDPCNGGEGSLSDSGISDSGSDQDIYEREKRLGEIRKLAKDMDILSPDSRLAAHLNQRVKEMECKLRELQQNCRNLIVKTALCAETSSVAPKRQVLLISNRCRSIPSLSQDNTAVNDNEDGDDGSKSSQFWRVLKFSVPFHVAIMLLACVACLLEPHCCDSLNNFHRSITQMRYLYGPPPI